MRHTHATLALEAGIHPKVVSERLGHASVSITLDTYSHVAPNMQQEAAEKIDAGLRAARGSMTQLPEPTACCHTAGSNRRFWQFRRVARAVVADSRYPRQSARTPLRVWRRLVAHASSCMTARPGASSQPAHETEASVWPR